MELQEEPLTPSLKEPLKELLKEPLKEPIFARFVLCFSFSVQWENNVVALSATEPPASTEWLLVLG